MTEAAKSGFHYGNPEWANLGQGAPETGPLPGANPRVYAIELEDSIHEYGPVPGIPELREAVAALYNARYRKGRRSQYTAENVAISSGGRAGLTRVAASLGNVHLGHMLPDYTAYEELLDVFKAFIPIPILVRPADGFRLSPEALREEVVGQGLGAILLSNPCNPTGHTVCGEDLDTWVRIGRDLGCALIFDEFYSHYQYDGEPGLVESAARYVENVDKDPVVIVDGLTKNWRYPGWRVSWTVAPRAVIDRVSSAGSFLDGGSSHPMQQAAVALVQPEVADREAVAIQRAFGTKRAVMLERLQRMGLKVYNEPAGAFYCFASLEGLPEPLNDGRAFFRAALERKVITVPGVFFDVNPGHRRSHIPSRMRGFVRLSFGPDLETVRTGLDRLEAMLS